MAYIYWISIKSIKIYAKSIMIQCNMYCQKTPSLTRLIRSNACATTRVYCESCSDRFNYFAHRHLSMTSEIWKLYSALWRSQKQQNFVHKHFTQSLVYSSLWKSSFRDLLPTYFCRQTVIIIKILTHYKEF